MILAGIFSANWYHLITALWEFCTKGRCMPVKASVKLTDWDCLSQAGEREIERERERERDNKVI